MVQQTYYGSFNGFGTTTLSAKRAGSSSYKNADVCNESIHDWFKKRAGKGQAKGETASCAQLTPQGILIRLSPVGKAVDAQRGTRTIKYENIRMVTKMPPKHANGRTMLAISSNNDGGLNGNGPARPMTLSNLSSQGKAFKIISHMFTPANDETLEEFYKHVTFQLTKRKRRPTMSAPTQRIAMSMLTQAAWTAAYQTEDKENGGGSTRRKSRSSSRRKSRGTRSTRTLADIFGDEVETVNGEEVWSF